MTELTIDKIIDAKSFLSMRQNFINSRQPPWVKQVEAAGITVSEEIKMRYANERCGYEKND